MRAVGVVAFVASSHRDALDALSRARAPDHNARSCSPSTRAPRTARSTRARTDRRRRIRVSVAIASTRGDDATRSRDAMTRAARGGTRDDAR